MDLERGSGQCLGHLCNCRSCQTRLRGEGFGNLVRPSWQELRPTSTEDGGPPHHQLLHLCEWRMRPSYRPRGAEGAGCTGLKRSFEASPCGTGVAATKLCREATDRRVATRATKKNPAEQSSLGRSYRPIGGYGRPRRKIPPSRVASSRAAGCGAALRKSYVRCWTLGKSSPAPPIFSDLLPLGS